MSREEYDVVFLVMSKLCEDAKEVTELIIDCSAVLKATVNKLFWEKKGFHRQLQSVVCKTHAKQTFNILIPTKDKDVMIKDNRKEIITLQFHPLRPNFIKYRLHCDHSTLRKLLGQIEIVKEALPVKEASDVVLENISLSVVLHKVYEESELTKEDNIQGDLVSQKEVECNELSLSIKSEDKERDMLQEKLFDSKADRNEDLKMKLPTDEIQNKTKHINTVFAEEMIDVKLIEQVKHPDIIEAKDDPAKGK